MPQVIREGRFEDHFQNLKLLIDWMSKCGVSVGSSRIRRYEKSFEDILTVTHNNDVETADERLPEFVNTLYEVHELMQVHAAFRNTEPSRPLIAALKEIVAGPEAAITEQGSASNRSRNTMFELLIASRLIQGGLAAEIIPPSDVTCELEGATVFFECKRPQSVAAIDRNLKRANSQIKTRIESRRPAKARGVIAIELTKCFMNESGILKHSSMSEIAQLTTHAATYLGNFIQAKSAVRYHKRILGVVGRISVMSVPTDPNGKLMYRQQYVFNLFRSASFLDQKLAGVLSKYLEGENAA